MGGRRGGRVRNREESAKRGPNRVRDSRRASWQERGDSRSNGPVLAGAQLEWKTADTRAPISDAGATHTAARPTATTAGHNVGCHHRATVVIGLAGCEPHTAEQIFLNRAHSQRFFGHLAHRNQPNLKEHPTVHLESTEGEGREELRRQW